MRALALLLLVAAPAAAQDFSYDPALLTNCLQANADKPDRCIGTAARACMEGEGGSTTVGTVSCLAGENAQWDSILNQAYEAVLADAEQGDAEMKKLGSAADPQTPALREMQRAWIAFRDAACVYEASRWGGGSGAGPAATACAMELTARQALRLKAYADQKY
ncbi:lysozyme inhibitor LprI family protein [Paracoccus xiamenensis]|uniref:lysozyme inhibitor LprI family protein n=1 Tax=Paracoccus xiamenensis TaxID=2714901 RepID=UPI00140A1439|nr:lysozyme inhibitor LprI family protein [Paracoccus xiamenensis]NHF72061.1 DUF1311 domain-containing protein [Paracoccus xiamenensis]